MPRHFLSVLFLTIVALIFASANFAQTSKDEITPEEKEAAIRLSERFIQRLIEVGDIEPLIEEMFVKDYLQQLSAEVGHGKSGDDFWFFRTLQFGGPEISRTAFEGATVADLRQYYLAKFRFTNYGFSAMLNRNAKSLLAATDSEDDDEDVDEDENTLKYAMYPKAVVEKMENDPYLANVILKTSLPSKPVANIGDLRRVNKTMSEVIALLRTKENAQRVKLTPDAKKLLQQSRQIVSTKFGYPMLGDIEGDHFGMPKGSRLIVTFASVGHMLLISKVGKEYKIIYAGIGSPD